jgi:hypothetical protein
MLGEFEGSSNVPNVHWDDDERFIPIGPNECAPCDWRFSDPIASDRKDAGILSNNVFSTRTRFGFARNCYDPRREEADLAAWSRAETRTAPGVKQT